jgi:hypothetical protein
MNIHIHASSCKQYSYKMFPPIIYVKETYADRQNSFSAKKEKADLNTLFIVTGGKNYYTTINS